MALAPRYFGRLPRAGCEVRAVEAFKEKDSPFAYYYPADDRRLAAGDLLRQHLRPAEPDRTPSSPRRPTTRRSPGTTSRSPSRWRTRTSTSSGGSARGWSAAPTSRAGASTPSGWPTRWASTAAEAERFGMLDGQAWRAARLVVDSGLHALRWPRQRSIDTLLAAGLSETDAIIETDRYICWPGQALTYKLGQREIERLRAQLAARDGARLRPARLPRRGPGPRLAAAGDARPRAAELGRDPGLIARRPRGRPRTSAAGGADRRGDLGRGRPGRPARRRSGCRRCRPSGRRPGRGAGRPSRPARSGPRP